MDRSTRNKVWGLMGALILCAGSTGFGQDIYLFGGETIAGDPNEPGPPDVNEPWDPAQHLSARWDAVSLTSRVYNPVSYPGRDPNVRDRSLSLSGHVRVTDSNDFIGLCILSTPVVAVDQDGNRFSGRVEGRRPPFLYAPPHAIWTRTLSGQWASELGPYGFSLGMSLDPNAAYPLFFRQLEWSMYALAADRFETVDLAFQTTGNWVELIPGLEVLVEKAAVSPRHYEYQMKVRCDRHKVCYLQSVVREAGRAAVPERTIVDMQVLNDQGQRVGPAGVDYSSSVSGAGSGEEGSYTGRAGDAEPDDLSNYICSGQATCDDCGYAAMFRFRLAVKPYEREVRFMLENVAMPSF